jgi:DNA-binding LacI/PurR family transcriptional regulator
VGSFYADLAETQVPVVLINNQQTGEYSFSVRSDDLYGGRLAGEYLISLGHCHIAYVAGPERAMSSERRLAGCQDALYRAGTAIPAEWIVSGNGLPEAGKRAVRPLLHAPTVPTAIFCYNDMTAMGVLRAVKAEGLRVPDDVSILGYDDIAAAPYLDPPLTTIAQAKYTLGQLATQMALDLIEGKTDVRDVLLKPQLFIRSSCATLAHRAGIVQ